jgi:hypothetical protein
MKTLITFNLSYGERDLLKRLAGGNVSAFLRSLIRQEAERQGYDLPDDLLEDTRATHGGLNKTT